MAYYPSSQITPNLYTNGGEFILSTSKENYKGYYYKLANGRLFTGKNPADKPNILLTILKFVEEYEVPVNLIQTLGDEGYLKTPTQERSLPTPYPPQLTPTDIQQGVFTRYFSKKNNELRYMEINKATFLLLINKSPQIAWDLYSADIINWHIKGDREKVYTVNESLVNHLETTNKWWGFSQYFKSNFSKYYIES